MTDEVFGWQWHQLDHMQTISTSLPTDNHTDTHHSISTGQMLFLTPNRQRQSTEGKWLQKEAAGKLSTDQTLGIGIHIGYWYQS